MVTSGAREVSTPDALCVLTDWFSAMDRLAPVSMAPSATTMPFFMGIPLPMAVATLEPPPRPEGEEGNSFQAAVADFPWIYRLRE
jgi:hypothetical protein